MKALRRFALRHPETVEGVACEGTALEKRTVRTGKKAFLFLGVADVMLKLRESLAEAARLAAQEPSRYKVGAHGWVTAKLGDRSPPLGLVEKWIHESYRVVLNEPSITKRKTTKKKRG